MNDSNEKSTNLEQLTAYLDGELNAAESEAIENRLSSDTEFRKEMQELQQTWDLLDKMDRPHSSEAFTKSTLEMVVLDATTEIRKNGSSFFGWPSRLMALCGLPLIACASAYSITNYVQGTSNRQLNEDRSVIENVDVYEKAESIEFLSLLKDSGLFADQEDESLQLDE